jgi:hypothetical protein
LFKIKLMYKLYQQKFTINRSSKGSSKWNLFSQESSNRIKE